MNFILSILVTLLAAIHLFGQENPLHPTYEDILEYFENLDEISSVAPIAYQHRRDSILLAIQSSPDSTRFQRPGQMGQELILQVRRNMGSRATRSTDVSREASKSGWGTSRYDIGEFVPGQDLNERRRIERKYFWLDVLKRAGMVIGGILIVYAPIQTVLCIKKRKNPWQDSSFSNDY